MKAISALVMFGLLAAIGERRWTAGLITTQGRARFGGWVPNLRTRSWQDMVAARLVARRASDEQLKYRWRSTTRNDRVCGRQCGLPAQPRKNPAISIQ